MTKRRGLRGWLGSRVTGSLLAAVLCFLPARAESPPGETAAAPAERWWAGVQVVEGSVRIPVVGHKTTRTETLIIARSRPTETGFVLEQRGCRVGFGRVAGVSVEMADAAARRLPMAPIHFDADGEGGYAARPWRVRWGAEDVDGSGHPGVTVRVRAPLCSGEVYVASDTRSVATATRADDVIEGRIRVRVTQTILDASRPCLRWFTSDSVDTMTGTFRFVPVPEGLTCDALLDRISDQASGP
jgi:hypothetical protein